MSITQPPRATRFGAGHVAAAVIAAWIVYVLVGGLEGTGQHFVVLGALRVVLFGALLAFAVAAGAHAGRLGRAGLAIAAVGAGAYLFGGIGSVATDGWAFDVFAGDGELDPPWYAYVLGLSGILFAVGTILVGIAGRSGGRLAIAVILAGAMFPAVFALQSPLGFAGAHIVWLVPWMVLAAGLIATPADQTRRGLHPAPAR
jgi:hypothetical protein